MIQTIIRYFQGYVKIYIEGDSSERFLNLCSFHHIYIWNLKRCGHAYELYMNINGFRKIRPIVRKTHIQIRIVGRYGFPFFLDHRKKRKAFLIGIFLCVLILKMCSNRIWDVHFEGNETWTDQTLMEFLETKNIHPAMLKKELNCSQIVKDIRAEYDDIVWVSASIDGSILQIKIKENEDDIQTADDISTKDSPTDLIATKDGTITKIITRSGVPLVHVGDEVKKGDILVSGRIEVMNDAKEVIGYQYERSDADILADTVEEYQDEIPVTYEKKLYDKKNQRYSAFVRIKSWSMKIGLEKNSFSRAEYYTYEHQITFGENFRIPITYGYCHVKGYHTRKETYKRAELQKQLSDNFLHFSKELEEKGIQMNRNSVKIHLNDFFASASGTLYLNQCISEPADTEILEIERNELE